MTDGNIRHCPKLCANVNTSFKFEFHIPKSHKKNIVLNITKGVQSVGLHAFCYVYI